MSLKSSARDHFLSQLRALQDNLNAIIRSEHSTSQPERALFNINRQTEDLFFVLDLSGKILNINDVVSESLYYTKEELLGLNFVDIVPTLQKKEAREFLTTLEQNNPSLSFHVSFSSAENKNIDCDCKALKKETVIYLLANLSQQEDTDSLSPFDLEHPEAREAFNLLNGKQSILATDGFKIQKPPGFPNPTSNILDGNRPEILSTANLNTPAIMSTVDINGFVTEVNDKWLTLLGYKKEEVLGKEALQFFDPASRKFISDVFIPEIASTGCAKSENCMMIARNGQHIQISLSGSLEYSSIQKIFKWFIFPKRPLDRISPPLPDKGAAEVDIAGGAVDQFTSSLNHLKAIINSSKQILFLIDKKMDIIAYNKHAEKIVRDYTSKQVQIGNNILEFLSDEDSRSLAEIFGEVLEGQSVHFTREMIFKDTSRRWFEVNLFPVEDELRTISNVVFSAEDITERKQAEEKYKELEINFKSIFSQVAVGVLLYDLNHKIIQANKRFYEMIEYSKEEFEDINPLGITHPEDREVSIKKTEELASGRIDYYSQEKRYVTKSGRIVWVFLTATVVKNRQGKPKHIISVAQDISLRKTAEQELLYKKSELDTFVYRASHDLRGPVASLMGLYNIVKVEFAHDKNAITYFEHYNNSVMRLHTVLQNLIDLTKIKESETKLSQVDLKELIESCLQSMKNLSDYNRIAFDISVDIDFKVIIDGKKFKTIIKNLVENSIIYSTPESTAYVKIGVSYQENVLKVEVSDNGRGIDPRIQSKVFNMFFRGTEKSKGSGLGLYIVKNAVEKLNGSIQLTSKLNEGTKFSVYIPYLYSEEYSALLEKNFVN